MNIIDLSITEANPEHFMGLQIPPRNPLNLIKYISLPNAKYIRFYCKDRTFQSDLALSSLSILFFSIKNIDYECFNFPYQVAILDDKYEEIKKISGIIGIDGIITRNSNKDEYLNDSILKISSQRYADGNKYWIYSTKTRKFMYLSGTAITNIFINRSAPDNNQKILEYISPFDFKKYYINNWNDEN